MGTKRVGKIGKFKSKNSQSPKINISFALASHHDLGCKVHLSFHVDIIGTIFLKLMRNAKVTQFHIAILKDK